MDRSATPHVEAKPYTQSEVVYSAIVHGAFLYIDDCPHALQDCRLNLLVLSHEPRRFLKRYAIYNSLFPWYLLLEAVGRGEKVEVKAKV